MGIVGTLRFWVMNLDPSTYQRLMDERKGKGTVVEALKTAFFSSVLPAIATAVIFILLGLMFGALFGALFSLAGSSSNAGLGAGVGFGLLYIVIGLVAAVFQLVLGPVFFLIGQGVQWVLARILGGKGSFAEQAYFSSYIYAGYATVSVLAFIPCVGSIVVMVAAILILYLTFIMLKQVHSLSSLRAAAVIIIPIAVVIAAYIGLVLLLRMY